MTGERRRSLVPVAASQPMARRSPRARSCYGKSAGMPVATLIVVPTSREAENIAQLTGAVRPSGRGRTYLSSTTFHLTDGTAAIVRQLTAK
jgi:hypothetical protein